MEVLPLQVEEGLLLFLLSDHHLVIQGRVGGEILGERPRPHRLWEGGCPRRLGSGIEGGVGG